MDEWLKGLLCQSLGVNPQSVTSLQVQSLAGSGGLSCQLSRVSFSVDGAPRSLVLKQHSGAVAKSLGLAREALWYSSPLSARFSAAVASHKLPSPLTVAVFADGSMDDGHKTLLLEDLAGAVQCGYYFGPGSPHNWQHRASLESLCSAAPLTAVEAASSAFRIAALLHSEFWMDPSLLGCPWLAGLPDHTAFAAAQRHAADAWAAAAERRGRGDSAVKWHPLVVECVTASLAKANWEEYREQRKKTAWTLIHGDFHPANMMMLPAKGDGGAPLRLVLLDWEVVGVGSGPQDIAQFLISHMDPELRRASEHKLVADYHALLTSSGRVSLDQYPLAQCMRDFVSGGAERWAWLLPVICGLCPDPMITFFHDQMLSFLQDHGVTPNTIGMPRV